MKQVLFLVAGMLLTAGCFDSEAVISKSKMGNLQINVVTAEWKNISNADIYVDGLYVGNPTTNFPILHVRRGERLIRVACAGYRPYERKINVLGEPNHQVLNVILEKE